MPQQLNTETMAIWNENYSPVPTSTQRLRKWGKMKEKGGVGMMLVPAVWYSKTCQ
jgi:hypothetical protein